MARAEVRPERWREDVQNNAAESSSLPSVARYCRGECWECRFTSPVYEPLSKAHLLTEANFPIQLK